MLQVKPITERKGLLEKKQTSNKKQIHISKKSVTDTTLAGLTRTTGRRFLSMALFSATLGLGGFVIITIKLDFAKKKLIGIII